MVRLLCLLIGYALGQFETGYLMGKAKHIDIRQHGSGNAGATNTLRILGWKAGLGVLFGDCFKCILAVVIVRFLFKERYNEMIPLLQTYAGVGCVLGHNHPVYLHFKGGKGIASTAGLILSTNLVFALIEFILFSGIVYTTRYVSIGSMAIVTAFFVETVIYGQMGGFHMAQPLLYEMYALVGFLMVSAIYRHRGNIKRLLQGTENKFSFK